MKSIVALDEYNEIDIRPSYLLQEYIRLTQEDVLSFLVEGKRLSESSCPGCNGKRISPSFMKFGLGYAECADCRTLFVSPRPQQADINRYYSQSPARMFWRDELSKLTDKKRKEKIFKPRFQWILESTQEHLSRAGHFVDINSAQYGYITEMAETEFFKQKTLLNPFLKLDNIKMKDKIDVVSSPSWDIELKDKVDVVSLFEVIDRIADVEAFLRSLRSILKDGGLCFITAILISGFDLQMLWDKAINLFPPDRLNVFSVEGMKSLFSRHGFECLEFSTPGVLDVEIVANAIEQNPQIGLPRFVEYMIKNRSSEAIMAFQEFLQANLLSSYGRILIRKAKHNK